MKPKFCLCGHPKSHHRKEKYHFGHEGKCDDCNCTCYTFWKDWKDSMTYEEFMLETDREIAR